jgi:hypothetical protein
MRFSFANTVPLASTSGKWFNTAQSHSLKRLMFHRKIVDAIMQFAPVDRASWRGRRT